MYIQITSRCNFHCAHCGLSCTARGHDISQENFTKALELAVEHGDHLCLGGGEPTLHPLFKDFIMQATWELASVAEDCGSPAVDVITNGSKTDIALNLARLSRAGVISASVSKDQYHDPIDERVYRAFERGDNTSDHDYRSIRNTSRDGNVVAAGRAKSWGNSPYLSCICTDLFITPNGNAYLCGCRKTKLGNIADSSFFIKPEWLEGYCEKSDSWKQRCKEIQQEELNLTAVSKGGP